MGPYWDDSSLSYSIYNKNNPVPYNYSQNPSTVAGAATANNNIWDYRSNVQAMFTAIEDSSALTFEEIVEDPQPEPSVTSDGVFDGLPATGLSECLCVCTVHGLTNGDIWWNDND